MPCNWSSIKTQCMLTKYQPPQFTSLVQQNISLLIVIMIIPAFTATAQNLPKKPTLQQLAGYHNQQQIKWHQKQLPSSSVTYKFGANYKQLQPTGVEKLKPMAIVPVNYVLPAAKNDDQNSPSSPLLQSLLLQERKDYMQWQKQSWWKDPNKLKGADLLRDFYISNRKS